MVYHFVLTLDGNRQQLVTAASTTKVGPLKQLILQADGANANPVYVGGNGLGGELSAVSSSAYGFRVEKANAGVPPAPTIIEAVNTSLGDWQVIGTNAEKLHVTCITA